jgi:cell division protein FtsI (penicillin-binding protein 3)
MAGHSDRRLRAGLLVILFVLTLFAGRLFQIQGLDASALAAQAQSKRTVEHVLPAHRGDITDVHGQVLATTIERKNVTVDQTIVGEYERRAGDQSVPVGVAGAAEDLARELDLPVEDVRAAITGTKRFAYVAKDISPEVWRRVADLRVPGVYEEAAPRRVYPSAEIGASVVGFVGKDGVALAGIEKSHNKALSGTAGSQVYERSRDGRQIPNALTDVKQPVAGSSIRLTIDRDIQWKAQSLLTEQVAKTNAERGYIVVQNSKSGDLLALASAPTFDANRPNKAEESDLTNRALLDIFEPGSTSKIITASAAVEEGAVTPATKMLVDDEIRRGGRVFHDSHSHDAEKLTFAGVLAKSSNVGSIMAGEKVTPERMYGYMGAFGLGKRVNVGLPEEPGILADAKDWNASQRYTVLFGQGLAVNAVQATTVFSTIANGGVRPAPRLLDATVEPDGTMHKTTRTAGTRVVSAKTAAQVSLMLENVVGEDGTGQNAEVPGYRVAGKTGTSQAPDERCGCYRGYTASFIGYAPADEPAITVAVILQRPKNGYYGGTVAAPVFQQVMTYGLARLGVAPTGKKAEKLPLEYR